MEILFEKLGVSIDHLKCLDKVFRENSEVYRQQESQMTDELGDDLLNITRELYVGGKKGGRKENSFSRQMILGDVIEFIFTGRSYYYISKSQGNFSSFAKLVLYCVNQLLIFDTITINPEIRKKYIEKLETVIPTNILYEREGDQQLATELKASDTVIWTSNWKKYDNFVDSILPKTLGCPKELVIFLELIRMNIGFVVPLLLTQEILAKGKAISPPDFLVLNKNKEIFGLEVGYHKEKQSREFSLQTSIPAFAIDLHENMHNRCPKCGENILYCDTIIKKYADGTLWTSLDKKGRFKCRANCCHDFNNGLCSFANYYGKYKGPCFYGQQKKGHEKKDRHYHAKCVLDDTYLYRMVKRRIKEQHLDDFFAQIPKIEGIDSMPEVN